MELQHLGDRTSIRPPHVPIVPTYRGHSLFFFHSWLFDVSESGIINKTGFSIVKHQYVAIIDNDSHPNQLQWGV
jgi:hypothetical protein